MLEQHRNEVNEGRDEADDDVGEDGAEEGRTLAEDGGSMDAAVEVEGGWAEMNEVAGIRRVSSLRGRIGGRSGEGREDNNENERR
jgi:hypothetical protein